MKSTLALVIIGLALVVSVGVFLFKSPNTDSTGSYVSAEQTNKPQQVTNSATQVSTGEDRVVLSKGPVTTRTDAESMMAKFVYLYDGSSIYYVSGGTVRELPQADPNTFVNFRSILETYPFAVDK